MAILAAALAAFVLGALQSAVVELATRRKGRIDVGTWLLWGLIVAAASAPSALLIGAWGVVVAAGLAAIIFGSTWLTILREPGRAAGPTD